MTLPNLITVLRLILVPVVIWLISEELLTAAFWLFVLAGISDGIDGFLAKRFGLASELGAYLDPLADKALLVSIYVSLSLGGWLPPWLVIMVVSRDILIVGAVLLSWVLSHPVTVRPLVVSKANTLAQIVLAATVLGGQAFPVQVSAAIPALIVAVALLTVISAGAYVVEWLRHMTKDDAGAGGGDGRS